MRITRWNVNTEGTTDLRDRAEHSMNRAMEAGARAARLVSDGIGEHGAQIISSRGDYVASAHTYRDSWCRIAVANARACLALLRAADRADALTGTVSDGLHYSDGQIYRVNSGRPESI